MARARKHSRPDEGTTRSVIARMLAGGRAHVAPMKALRAFPPALRAAKPRGAPHTAWELLEHLRIAQRDILDFSRDPEHPSPDWPAGFWPPSAEPPGPRAWARSVRAFESD